MARARALAVPAEEELELELEREEEASGSRLGIAALHRITSPQGSKRFERLTYAKITKRNINTTTIIIIIIADITATILESYHCNYTNPPTQR